MSLAGVIAALDRAIDSALTEKRIIGCGFFKPEAEPHRGFGQHCYGALPASKGIF